MNKSKILQEVKKPRKDYNQWHLDLIVPQSQQVVVPPTLEAAVCPNEKAVFASVQEDVVPQGQEDVRGQCLSHIEGLTYTQAGDSHKSINATEKIRLPTLQVQPMLFLWILKP